MSVELKIKAASLAAESAIIKRIERKLAKARQRLKVYETKVVVGNIDAGPNAGAQFCTIRGSGFTYTKPDGAKWDAELQLKHESIANHRRNEVRWASRTTHLARNFIKGRSHLTTETEPKEAKRAELNRKHLSIVLPKPIAEMARKYGGPKFSNTTPEQVKDWLFK